MQWSDLPYAGFTEGTPWIKVNPNYPEINVERDLARPDSIYRYYQRLIALRKANPILVYGDYLDHEYPSEALYVFERRLDTQRWIILANTSSEPVTYRGSALAERGDELMSARLILGNDLEREQAHQELDLRSDLQLAPYEVIVCELQG